MLKDSQIIILGVFSITPITSTDVSDCGENDTSALEKEVRAGMTAFLQ